MNALIDAAPAAPLHRDDLDARGFRRMLFNSCADPKLLAAYQDRSTELYAALSCALAIITAIAVAAFVYQGFSALVAWTGLAVAVLLVGSAAYAERLRTRMRSAWAVTFGMLEARKLGQQFGDRENEPPS